MFLCGLYFWSWQAKSTFGCSMQASSLWCLLLLRAWALARLGFGSCGSRALEHRSMVVTHRLSCSVACGIFLNQGSNPYLLHWQADSLPLSHQGSPLCAFLIKHSHKFYFLCRCLRQGTYRIKVNSESHTSM